MFVSVNYTTPLYLSCPMHTTIFQYCDNGQIYDRCFAQKKYLITYIFDIRIYWNWQYSFSAIQLILFSSNVNNWFTKADMKAMRVHCWQQWCCFIRAHITLNSKNTPLWSQKQDIACKYGYPIEIRRQTHEIKLIFSVDTVNSTKYNAYGIFLRYLVRYSLGFECLINFPTKMAEYVS